MTSRTKGKFYGVGIGPGDPELLTLKAVRILEEADIIAIPDGGKERTALKIIEGLIADKTILDVSTPMTWDPETKQRYKKEAAALIRVHLEQGKTVAMVTLGDPTIYSSVTYLSELLQEQGCEIELIPGIPSFTAAACRLGISLCEGSETVSIIPASYEKLEQRLEVPGAKVLMKSGRAIRKVQELLEAKGLLEQTSAVEKATMPDEKVYEDLSAVDEPIGYLSTLIIKEREKK